jgi:hypothetical protein
VKDGRGELQFAELDACAATAPGAQRCTRVRTLSSFGRRASQCHELLGPGPLVAALPVQRLPEGLTISNGFFPALEPARRKR